LSEIRHPVREQALDVWRQWLGQHLSYCIDVFYRDAPLPRIRHMLNRRHMPTGSSPAGSVCTLPKRGVMSLPKISNGRSRRIGERKRTEWLYAAEMETLRMITQGATLTDILNHVCASIDRLISPSITTILLMDS